MTKKVTWTDDEGRSHVVLLPDYAEESEAPKGVPLLAIDVDDLGLPPALATRLHNQLVARELWDEQAIRRKGGRTALLGALMGALKSLVIELERLYRRE